MFVSPPPTSEGWEQNGLYEFFRAKMRARRKKEQEKHNRWRLLDPGTSAHLVFPRLLTLRSAFFQRPRRSFVQEPVSQQGQVLLQIQLSLLQVIPLPIPEPLPFPEPLPLLLQVQVQVCAHRRSFG